MTQPTCDKCDKPVTVVIHGDPEMNLCRDHFNEWCEKRKKVKYQEASALYHVTKHETESGRGIERIRKALDEARQEGHAVGYDECLDDYQTS